MLKGRMHYEDSAPTNWIQELQWVDIDLLSGRGTQSVEGAGVR